MAKSGTVTATVRPNPLDIQVSTPSTIEVGDWFNIEVTITNKGAAPITKTFAKIHTSSDLKLKTRGKKKRIGTLTAGQTIIWKAKANKTGNYVIQIDIEGFLEGKKITADDSAIVDVTDSILLSWFRAFFGL